MNIRDIHQQCKNDTAHIRFHEFRLRYVKNSKIIYGFVEGKEDLSFYRGFIENNIPPDWQVEIWASGNKDKVYEIYNKFDWRRYNKLQILFFSDRDLSEFTNKNIKNELNIYITDGYSIENDIVNINTCNRILREICGFSELSYQESEEIKKLFNKQLHKFQLALVPVMANIIKWQIEKKKVCLNDILMKHIFKINNGIIEQISNPKNKVNLISYIYSQCNLQCIDQELIKDIANNFIKKGHYKKFIRGKYLLWFLIEFCLSIYHDYKSILFLSNQRKPKMHVNLSQKNGIVLIAPRCRIPKKMINFFRNTIQKYITPKIAS